MEELTYKKWKPLARVGMVVRASLDRGKARSFYTLTIEDEKGVVSVTDDEHTDAILKKNARFLKYSPYPIVFWTGNYVTALIRRFVWVK